MAILLPQNWVGLFFSLTCFFSAAFQGNRRFALPQIRKAADGIFHVRPTGSCGKTMWAIERPASMIDQQPNVSQQFRDIIEKHRLSASEFNLLNRRLFPMSFANHPNHTIFGHVSGGDQRLFSPNHSS
jgi:hypothetical protein